METARSAPEDQGADQLVRDLVPLLHCLRARYKEQEEQLRPAAHSRNEQQQREEEEKYILSQLQLPTAELECLLAEEGFSYDDLQLVTRIRQATREAVLTNSSPAPNTPTTATSSTSLPSLLKRASEGVLPGSSGGHPGHHPRLLEDLRLEIAAEVAASTSALPEAALLVASSPSTQAHKKGKLYFIASWQ